MHVTSTVHQHGYTALGWSDGGMRYIAVSGVEPGELEQFMRDFRDHDAGAR